MATEPFIGELMLVGYNFAPRGWALCNGQLLSIAQNTALFSLLGTQYGGDGRVTYGLPDLRGRFPLSQGQAPGLPSYTVGQVGGTPTQTLTVNNLPGHSHQLRSTNSAATTSRPNGAYPAAGGSYAGAADGTMAIDAALPAGGGQPIDNMPPYLTLSWCIALEGIFPSRN